MNTNKYLAEFTDLTRSQIKELFGGLLNKAFLPIIEVTFWGIALLLFDFLMQKIFGKIFGWIFNRPKFTWTKQFYAHKVFRTLIHFFTVYLLVSINPYVAQRYHGIDKFTDKFIGLLIIVLFILFIFRVIDAIIDINENKDSHTTVGVRTFGQLIKIFVAFFGFLTFIATLIDVALSQIFTVLGALTAVVLLIFRDSILGFISGLQISTSKSIKIGDWISVSKYEVEGVVKEINLAVTKIEKFDKTISTVPTYDLIASEVTNHSWMSLTNTRRIKRSIVFNVNSFQFCNESFIQELEKIDLISTYIQTKRKEISTANQHLKHPEKIINGRQLTNIGLFRIYAINYLKSRSDISQEDKMVVRQLEPNSFGMPLEIYCFTTDAQFDVYEQIQADVFDHLITASKTFQLEVSQPFVIQQNND
ncbi:MAG TPA: mechanosensitive ion channel domain-containing protein [Moheibacter sp.]|nr:mechanosensitive ion channel domain-containing protein [Moheibacter sp.]